MEQQPLKYYFVLADFNSDNLDTNPKGAASQAKFFKKNELIIGNLTDAGSEKVVVTLDGFYLPLDKVTEVKDQEAAKKLTEAEQRIKKVINRDFIKEAMKASKYSVNGASAGILIGVVYSLATKKSMMWCAFIGAFVGGGIGYGVSKIGKKKE